jgi:hypothetical protein
MAAVRPPLRAGLPTRCTAGLRAVAARPAMRRELWATCACQAWHVLGAVADEHLARCEQYIWGLHRAVNAVVQWSAVEEPTGLKIRLATHDGSVTAIMNSNQSCHGALDERGLHRIDRLSMKAAWQCILYRATHRWGKGMEL